MTPTREERARVLAGVAWQSQTRPTLSDFDFFRDGFVDGYTWEDAEVERLRKQVETATALAIQRGQDFQKQTAEVERLREENRRLENKIIAARDFIVIGEYTLADDHLKAALAQPSDGEGSDDA